MAIGKDGVELHSNAATILLSQLSDVGKRNVAQVLYYDELETIRRDKPLVDPRVYPIQDVKALRTEAKKNNTNPLREQPLTISLPASAATEFLKATVIDLVSSPEPDDDPLNKIAGSHAAPIGLASSPELTGQSSTKGKAADRTGLSTLEGIAPEANNPDRGYDFRKNTTLRYHDVASSPGQWPSPAAGLRFDVKKFKKDYGWGTTMEDTFMAELNDGAIDLYALNTGDQEGIMRGSAWCIGDSRHPRNKAGHLIRGFPLIERVVFLRSHNHWSGVSSGSCYWTALAMLMYGNPAAWLRVKAEHLAHFERVLRNPTNPRHSLYRKLNEKWYRTRAEAIDKRPADKNTFEANLWQVLHLPGVYVPMNMMDITADLYNVFLVMYSYVEAGGRNGGVYETKTRGAYNSRHLFLLYIDSIHFQPLVPNDFLHWEFTLPRITQRSTKGLPLAASRKDGIKHPWRSELRSAGGQKAPLLIDRAWNIETAAAAVGFEAKALPVKAPEAKVPTLRAPEAKVPEAKAPTARAPEPTEPAAIRLGLSAEVVGREGIKRKIDELDVEGDEEDQRDTPAPKKPRVEPKQASRSRGTGKGWEHIKKEVEKARASGRDFTQALPPGRCGAQTNLPRVLPPGRTGVQTHLPRVLPPGRIGVQQNVPLAGDRRHNSRLGRRPSRFGDFLSRAKEGK